MTRRNPKLSPVGVYRALERMFADDHAFLDELHGRQDDVMVAINAVLGDVLLPHVFGAGLAVIRPHEGQILLVRAVGADVGTFGHAAGWSIPKGKVDPGEDAELTAFREVLEETGVLLTPADVLSGPHEVEGERSQFLRYWIVPDPGEPDELPVDQLQASEIAEARFVTFDDARMMLEPYQRPILDVAADTAAAAVLQGARRSAAAFAEEQGFAPALTEKEQSDIAWLRGKAAEGDSWAREQLTALAVKCPVCGAEPEHLCTIRQTHSRGQAHVPRIRLAMREAAKAAKAAPPPPPVRLEAGEEPVEEEGRQWVYGASLRPVGFASVPSGYVGTGTHPDFKTFGTVIYPERLPFDQQRGATLYLIPEPEDVREFVEGVAAEMEYPVETLQEAEEDPRYLEQAVGEYLDGELIWLKREEAAPLVLEALRRRVASMAPAPVEEEPEVEEVEEVKAVEETGPRPGPWDGVIVTRELPNLWEVEEKSGISADLLFPIAVIYRDEWRIPWHQAIRLAWDFLREDGPIGEAKRRDPEDADAVFTHSAAEGTLLETDSREWNDVIKSGMGLGMRWARSLGMWSRARSRGKRVPTVGLARVVRVLGDAGATVSIEVEEPVSLSEALRAKAAARRESAEYRRARQLDKARKAGSAFEAARGAVAGIEPGQPILVGHHSEKRHRRALERHDTAMRRGIEAQERASAQAWTARSLEREAERYEREAERAEARERAEAEAQAVGEERWAEWEAVVEDILDQQRRGNPPVEVVREVYSEALRRAPHLAALVEADPERARGIIVRLLVAREGALSMPDPVRPKLQAIVDLPAIEVLSWTTLPPVREAARPLAMSVGGYSDDELEAVWQHLSTMGAPPALMRTVTEERDAREARRQSQARELEGADDRTRRLVEAIRERTGFALGAAQVAALRDLDDAGLARLYRRNRKAATPYQHAYLEAIRAELFDRGRLAELEPPPRKARGELPAAVLPIGPHTRGSNPICSTVAPLWDSEGRRYSVEYKVIPGKMDGTGPVRPSNMPGTFQRTPAYPAVFQARDLSTPSESAKIQNIARNLEPDRLIWPQSDPTLGAPVVWGNPDGAFDVLGGNGRTIALLMAPEERYQAYLDDIRAKWPGLLPETDQPGYRSILVRVVSHQDGRALSFDDAVMLAGASQESTAAAESPLGRALSVIRGLGILDVGQLPPFTWKEPITRDNIERFQSDNPEFWGDLLGRMDPAKRAAYRQAAKGAELVKQISVGYLPDEVRRGGFGDEATEEALLGALPLMVSLEGQIRSGDVKPQWSLLSELPDAVQLYRVIRKQRIPIAKLPDLLEAEARQGKIGEVETLLSGISLLGFYLAVALYRASRLKDPADAVGKYFDPYYAAALEDHPAAMSMFGAAAAADPAATLAAALGLRVPTDLPAGMKRAANPRATPAQRQRYHLEKAGQSLLFDPGDHLPQCYGCPDAFGYVPQMEPDGTVAQVGITKPGGPYTIEHQDGLTLRDGEPVDPREVGNDAERYGFRVLVRGPMPWVGKGTEHLDLSDPHPKLKQHPYRGPLFEDPEIQGMRSRYGNPARYLSPQLSHNALVEAQREHGNEWLLGYLEAMIEAGHYAAIPSGLLGWFDQMQQDYYYTPDGRLRESEDTRAGAAQARQDIAAARYQGVPRRNLTALRGEDATKVRQLLAYIETDPTWVNTGPLPEEVKLAGQHRLVRGVREHVEDSGRRLVLVEITKAGRRWLAHQRDLEESRYVQSQGRMF